LNFIRLEDPEGEFVTDCIIALDESLLFVVLSFDCLGLFSLDDLLFNIVKLFNGDEDNDEDDVTVVEGEEPPDDVCCSNLVKLLMFCTGKSILNIKLFVESN
jgi:hypothetical protein